MFIGILPKISKLSAVIHSADQNLLNLSCILHKNQLETKLSQSQQGSVPCDNDTYDNVLWSTVHENVAYDNVLLLTLCENVTYIIRQRSFFHSV